MAGIGFELNKILYKGTLSSIIKVFLLGAIIVAGPWVLSVISIYSIQKYAYIAIAENAALFTVTIVYIYAFSLILFGGTHYVFSRYIADMLYIENDKNIPSSLVTIFLLVTILGAIISGAFVNLIELPNISNINLYKGSFILLFVSVNLIWIMLVYVALLKEYYKIFISYMAGSLASILGVYYLGKIYSIGGALLGYSFGQMVIVLMLILISNRSYKIKIFSFNFELLTYFKKFLYLFFIGVFFNLGIWTDKIIYWFTYGEKLKNTSFYFYLDYDIPVFLAFLSMIPGLIYFLVITEPIFHRAYIKFIKNIMTDRISHIEDNKSNMINSLNSGFKKLILFQGIWTLTLMFNLKKIVNYMGYGTVKESIMITLLAAVFFHLLFMTLQIYLMYLEFRKEALLSTLIYFLFNLVFTFIFIRINFVHPGTSYLISSFIAASYCFYYIKKRIPFIDFIIFTRN